MNDLITVIVPVYNVESYLEKCVTSICSQTYHNLEIFLVDDGSPDNCPVMCDEFAKKDSRIRVIHKRNGGQGSARNLALDYATGNFISFVDSDDSVKEDYIEFLYKLIIDNSLDISVCNNEMFDENGNYIKRRKDGTGYVELTSLEAINSLWTQGIINIGPWGKLYKRELWENIRFKECFGEDFATMHYVFEKAQKIGFSYECKLNYLVRGNSDIRSFQTKKLEMIEIAEDNIGYCSNHPELLSAAQQKAVSVYFHLLFQLPDDQCYDEVKKSLIKKIKDLRLTVLKDKNCIKRTRIALIMSFISFRFTKFVFLKNKKSCKKVFK